MQFPNDIDSLWEMWEQNVLSKGLDDQQVDLLGHHIEKLEAQDELFAHDNEELEAHPLSRAHRIFDQLCSKKRHPERLNHSLPGNRVIRTRYGAIYENAIVVRGMERLLKHHGNNLQAVRLTDGIYHVNHMPGVQPNASEQVNARNKNVEKVAAEVVDRFVRACQETGMNKRGWKKSVNEQFDISRQEFTKWLTRYFPLYHLPIPIERKGH
jgi:hypothetical protein